MTRAPWAPATLLTVAAAAILLTLLPSTAGKPPSAPLRPGPLDLSRCDLQGLFRDLEQYQVFNAPHHQGYLTDHSVWTARAIANWFAQGDEWVRGIPERLVDVTLLGALLHDVGKAGDPAVYAGPTDDSEFQIETCGGGDCRLLFNWKDGHPRTGFEYLAGRRTYHWLVEPDDGCAAWRQDLGRYLQCSCPLTNEERYVLSLAVGMHYSFGDYLQNPNAPGDYLDRFLAYSSQLEDALDYRPDVQGAAQLVELFCAIGAADVWGAHEAKDPSDGAHRAFLEPFRAEPRYLVQGSQWPYEKYHYDKAHQKMRDLSSYVRANWPPRPGRSRS